LLYFGSGGFSSIYESDRFLAVEQYVSVVELVVVKGEAATLNLVCAAPHINAGGKLFSPAHEKQTERQHA
jgi:hypothetical protein